MAINTWGDLKELLKDAPDDAILNINFIDDITGTGYIAGIQMAMVSPAVRLSGGGEVPALVNVVLKERRFYKKEKG